MSRVVVVGGGVSGLCTAVATQRRLPRLHVTLVSDQFSPETTGDGSAGLWVPYLLGNTPMENVMRWAGRTYAMMRELWQSPQAAEAGISLLPAMWLTTDKAAELPVWRNLVMGFNSLSRKELEQLGAQHGRKYSVGCTFLTFTCEPTRLLPFLTKEFQARGGVMQRRRVESLADLARDGYDVIVNCTGLAARRLADDPSVVPVRGQVVRVKAPWVHLAILDDSDDGNYIIPNQDAVVLGGTHQEGDWNLAASKKDREFIEQGCRKMMPCLKGAETVQEWVGLRPGRPSVRVDRETRTGWDKEKFEVVHNYGHGGSGVTLCWGCAEDAVELIERAALDVRPRPRL